MALVSRTTLTGAKDEYAERLFSVLGPQMNSGIRDIFAEATQVCVDTGEPHKYLMTFQNFLAKVPSWSSATVEEETARIVENSGCDYMSELVACVHVAHLKLLTSIRPSETSREVELPMPSLSSFIHKAYTVVARKLWKSTFLFETGIMPLEQQKHAREVEAIIRESILDAVRESLPVDAILKNYLKGVEETVDVQSGGSGAEMSATAVIAVPGDLTPVISSIVPLEAAAESQPESSAAQNGLTAHVQTVQASAPPTLTNAAEPKRVIGFTDSDNVLNMGTNTTESVPAPKDIASLAAKSVPIHGAPLPSEDDDDGMLTIATETVDNALGGLVEEL